MMEREEIIKALRRLKVETGSIACLGCGYEHNCGAHGCAIIRDAEVMLDLDAKEVASLRAQLTDLRKNYVATEMYRKMYRMACEERDAAVNDLLLTNTRKFNCPCEICKHLGEKCEPVDLQSVCCKWEWRGVQKGKE